MLRYYSLTYGVDALYVCVFYFPVCVCMLTYMCNFAINFISSCRRSTIACIMNVTHMDADTHTHRHAALAQTEQR